MYWCSKSIETVAAFTKTEMKNEWNDFLQKSLLGIQHFLKIIDITLCIDIFYQGSFIKTQAMIDIGILMHILKGTLVS